MASVKADAPCSRSYNIVESVSFLGKRPEGSLPGNHLCGRRKSLNERMYHTAASVSAAAPGRSLKVQEYRVRVKIF